VPTLAFWNVAHKVALETIAAFAHEADADILILADNDISNHGLVLALNAGVNRFYFPDPLQSGRLTIFARFLQNPSDLIRDDDYVAIRHYRIPPGESFLVVAAHLPSKRNRSADDQVQLATRIGRLIREAEEKVSHRRTVLIGDLNMNPFEAGVVGSEGLHAIMDRNIASRDTRRVLGEDRLFFYNPMWSFFGDHGAGSHGTYFYDSGKEVNYYWHIFDQVLIRPSLLKYIDKDSVRIMTEVAGINLLTENRRPDRRTHSDHLPLVCRLNLKEDPSHG
jgi:hypothetical protein